MTAKFKMPKYTDMFKNALDALVDSRAVLIHGPLGSGKSHVALDLMSTLMAENPDYDAVILPSPRDLRVLQNSPTPLVLLIDDCYGQGGSSRQYCNTFNKWIHMLTSMIEKKKIYIILTTSPEHMKELTEADTALLERLGTIQVDLCLESNAMNNQDKCKMLSSWFAVYSKTSNSNKKYLSELIEKYDGLVEEGTNTEIGFPGLCQLTGVVNASHLFENTVGALDYTLSNIYKRQPHTFAAIIAVILAGALNKEDISEDILNTSAEIVGEQDLSVEDIKQSVSTLKVLGILTENTEGSLIVTSRAFYLFCVKFLVNGPSGKIVPMLSPKALNSITFDIQNTDHDRISAQNIHPVCDLDMQVISDVASNFSKALETKDPSLFFDVAASTLWKSSEFVENIFRFYGHNFFLFEDAQKQPFAAYLMLTDNITPNELLVNIVSNSHIPNMANLIQSMETVKVEACTIDHEIMLTVLFQVAPNITREMVEAAVEYHHTDLTIQLLQSSIDAGSTLIDSSLTRLVCRKGHYVVLKFILSKLSERDIRAEITRRDMQGMTALHHTAIGGNVDIYIDLVKYSMTTNAAGKTKNGLTLLHICALNGHLNLLKHICGQHPQMMYERGDHNMHVIHVAAREGQLEIIKFILDTTVNPEIQADEENTVAHFTAINGWTNILMMLLSISSKYLYDINSKSFAAPHLAAKFGQTETLRRLIEEGVDPLMTTIDSRSFLHLASFGGHRDTVHFLQECCPDICTMRDFDGNSPLHDAAAGGNIQVFNDLVNAGMDPLVANEDGATALHDACFYGKKEMVQYLCLNYPELIKAKTSLGLTPAFGASLGGNLEVLQFLEENGANMQMTSKELSTLLHEAAFAGKLDVVKYLSQKFPSLVHCRNDRSFMPCHFAAQEGHLDVMLYLLPKSPQLFPLTKENQTILHISAYNKMLQLVKHICQKFPSLINSVDSDGAYALHYAARGGSIECFDCIVKNGGNPMVKTEAHSSVLHLAAYDGNNEMVAHICARYPKLVNEVDSTGHSPAHYAAGGGDLSLLKDILSYGVDPLVTSENGATLLMKATWNGRLDIAQYLCTSYPDLKAMKDSLGCGCLHYAACGGHIDVIDYLVKEGLDPEVTSNEGHTMLHVAIYHDQESAVKYITECFPSLLSVNDDNGNSTRDYAKLSKNTKLIHLVDTAFMRSGKSGLVDDVFCCEDSCLNRLCSFLCCCRK